jgi:hypothetical protein
MPDITNPRQRDRVETDPVTARVRDTRDGLAVLLQEAEVARQQRAESASKNDSAVCA